MIKDFLLDGLSDLYSAESQLIQALPKMAEAANSTDLRDGFLKHLKQTEEQAERLRSAFKSLGSSPKPKACKGMMGLIEEGEEVIREGEEKDEVEADLALVGAAQRIEHYEISGYGTARTAAERIGEENVARLLAQSLEEEEQTDELLTSVAESLYEQLIEDDEEPPSQREPEQSRV
jgi:Mn-containing catalase